MFFATQAKDIHARDVIKTTSIASNMSRASHKIEVQTP
jgi:hypothetical protein